VKRTMPSSPVFACQYYAGYLKSRTKAGQNFHRNEGFFFISTGVWWWDFERTLRGIALYAGLDAHRLSTG
jgi:hypothetical protein